MQEQKKKKKEKGFVKKGLILALVGAMVFAMAACGGKDDKSPQQKALPGAAQAPKKKIPIRKALNLKKGLR